MNRCLTFFAAAWVAFFHAAGPAGVHAALPLEVVSEPYTNIARAFGDSTGTLLSADGRWVVFNSSGNGLATNDANGLMLDVFIRDTETAATTLVSRNAQGFSANGDSLINGISADGRLTVFESDASDLVPGDTNDTWDVFIYDRTAGTIDLVSRTAAGQSAGPSGAAQITANGKFVLFESAGANLAAVDNNDTPDLFQLNLETGDLKLVTINSNNTAAASAPSALPVLGLLTASMSEDGRYVAFLSEATNLAVPRVRANAGAQLFLRDMTMGTNTWISRKITGFSAGSVGNPVLSSNGTMLAFLSERLLGTPAAVWLHFYSVQSNFVSEAPLPPGVGNYGNIDRFALSADGTIATYLLNGQVYRFDLVASTTVRVTSTPDGMPGNDTSELPAISDDGKVIVFTSAATNLVAGAASSVLQPFQLYRYDHSDGTLALLSPNASGSGGMNRDVLFPDLSSDGSTVGFTTYASDLLEGDDKNANDVFVVSTSGTNAVQLVSTPHPRAISATAIAASDLQPQALSRNGRFVVFSSFASDLVRGDDNDAGDVFLRDLQAGRTRLVSSPDGIRPYASGSQVLSTSREGRHIAYAASDESAERTVYVFDATAGTSVVGSVLPDGSTAPSTEASLSADGQVLAFRVVTGNPRGIFVRDLPAQQSFYVTNFSSLQPQQFAVSPSGRFVLVSNPNTMLLMDWRNGTNLGVTTTGGSDRPQFAENEEAMLFFSRSTILGADGASLFLYSLADNTTNLIATNALSAGISADASTIALWAAGETARELMIHDVRNQTTTTVPFTSADEPGSYLDVPALSKDGRFIVFEATSAETDGFRQVFVYDRVLTNLTLVSGSTAGAGNFSANDPSISADGRTIVFQSGASDLVENDRNFSSDVFVARVPVIDSDVDQLEDGWELLTFDNLDATGEQDSDGDGISNLEEFLNGTDANGPGAQLRLEAFSGELPGTITIRAQVINGETYQLQFTENLAAGTWENAGEPGIASSNTWTVSANADGRAGFYRVRRVE